jgi:hypothetical protein
MLVELYVSVTGGVCLEVYESCDLHMVLFSGTLVISSHFPCILDFGLILIVDFSLICQFVIYLCSLYIYIPKAWPLSWGFICYLMCIIFWHSVMYVHISFGGQCSIQPVVSSLLRYSHDVFSVCFIYPNLFHHSLPFCTFYSSRKMQNVPVCYWWCNHSRYERSAHHWPQLASPLLLMMQPLQKWTTTSSLARCLVCMQFLVNLYRVFFFGTTLSAKKIINIVQYSWGDTIFLVAFVQLTYIVFQWLCRLYTMS